jgi:SAM-dependent methyltransferase
MSEFDVKASTWDDDPKRVGRAGTVADAIRAAVSLNAETSVFEYGCGTGLLGFALRPFVRSVTLADSSPGMLEVLNRKIAASGMKGLNPVRLDLITDPVPPDRYDLVVSLLVLHHVPDTGRILSAFHSLLKSPGRLAVADLDAEDGSFHGAGFDGHRGFDREALGRKAVQAGFSGLRFTTALRIAKQTDRGPMEFPVFLMTGEK